MQCDTLIWQTIAYNFCSFKVKTETQNFCRNSYNLTGLCSQQACPLANSRYATIKLHADGMLYLYVKVIERAHLPSQMWEKIKLSKNFANSLKQIDEELIYWPEFIINKCKQRLTKLQQTLKRSRRLLVKTTPKLVSVHKKIDRRESKREEKAEKMAKLEISIEKELLNRLKMGVYDGGVINEDSVAFDKALDEMEMEAEYEDEEEEEEEEDMLEREFVSDVSDDEDDIEDFGFDADDKSASELDSDDDVIDKKKVSKVAPRAKKSHVHVEYEQERETEALKW